MKTLVQFEIEKGVTVKVYPETDPDWSWVDDEASSECNDLFKRKIRNGDVEQVIVEVIAYDKTGEVSGSDSIGGVVVDIDDHKQEIRDTIESYEMIENAKTDLKSKLDKIIKANKRA